MKIIKVKQYLYCVQVYTQYTIFYLYNLLKKYILCIKYFGINIEI